MKYLKSVLLLCFHLNLLISCSSEDQPNQTQESIDYKAITNVSYGNSPDQVFDIYLPENRSIHTKVMILVHGGGWNAGDKNDVDEFKNFILDELPDVAVINMNYRLADQDNPPHPMQLDDITTVINVLKENQSKYQIGNEIGLMGFSAGGHLALLWSYNYDITKQVNMVCSIVGPTNLADDAYINSDNEALKDLIFQFGKDIDVLKSVSPLFYVTSSSPPTLLFYGAQDPLVPNSQGIDLKEKLENLNVVNEFTLYPNGGHGWVGLDLLDTSVKLKAFIENHL